MTLTAGSLFSGAGWLSVAVEQAMGATTRWVSDVEPAANAILARRFPDATNLGDITTIDWATMEPVDIIEGGSPCTDISTAGRRAGMTEGTRSNLWVAMRDAIAAIKPAIVVWENVAGSRSASASSTSDDPTPDPYHAWRLDILRTEQSMTRIERKQARNGSPKLRRQARRLMVRRERLLAEKRRPRDPVLRALGRVLGDLSELGFNAEWVTVRASDVGACHQRARVFVLAWHPERVGVEGHRAEGVKVTASPAGTRVSGCADRGSDGLSLLPTPVADNSRGLPSKGTDFQSLPNAVCDLLPTPSVADGTGGHERRGGARGNELLLPGVAKERASLTDWGKYAPAIDHHTRMLNRPHPAPTITGARGNPKLSAHFTEWMMCAPGGWIGDLVDDGTITNNAGLRLSGNGVVIPQAVHAIRGMLVRADLTGRAAA